MAYAIVAIPSKDQVVWQASSEKVPHLTLLYFGTEAIGESDAQAILTFLEHAVPQTFTHQVWTEVKTRGLLGSDNADVLFLSKKDLPFITFRDTLLKNNTIRKLYDRTDQFEPWVPHVTLGYPEAPAIEIQEEDHRKWYGFETVIFDRIAFWDGDYEGTEFEFKMNDDEFALPNSPIEIGDTAFHNILNSELLKSFLETGNAESVLAHYGIRGQRWGIRRRPGADGTVGSGSKAETTDAPSASVEKKSGSDSTSGEHLSADAERFIRTHQKEGHEMSDQELKSAINRANMVKQYNDIFGPKPNADLETKVRALELQKRYNDLSAELNPSKLKRVLGFVESSNSAYQSYNKLNESTGGELNKVVIDTLSTIGLASKSGGKHAKV